MPLVILFVLLSGCNKPTIRHYTTPKEPLPLFSIVKSGLNWQAPNHWISLPPHPMRLASYQIGKSLLTITQLPGSAGSVLANINRWRGQLQLGPVQEPDLNQILQTLPHPTLQIILTDLTHQKNRIIVAMIPQNRTWIYVKLSGTHSDLDKPEFIRFLRTFQP